MSDAKKMAAEQVAARDRVYGFLGINGCKAMKFVNAGSFEDTLEVFKKHPDLLYIIKIMTICSVREIWDSYQGPLDRSPVGTWTTIDGERQGAMQDPRAQVAAMISGAWTDNDGDEADCRIWINSKIDELNDMLQGTENDVMTAIVRMLPPAMELMLQVHRLFGPDEADLLPRLDEVVRAYGGHDKLEDLTDSGEYQKTVGKIVLSMEKLIDKNERRAKDGEAN